MVAQIDEQHAAMVANTMAPASEADRLIGVRFAEIAAGVGPVTMNHVFAGCQIKGRTEI
jgi:hypothetical protein